jgi:hypothetical protein
LSQLIDSVVAATRGTFFALPSACAYESLREALSGAVAHALDGEIWPSARVLTTLWTAINDKENVSGTVYWTFFKRLLPEVEIEIEGA